MQAITVLPEALEVLALAAILLWRAAMALLPLAMLKHRAAVFMQQGKAVSRSVAALLVQATSVRLLWVLGTIILAGRLFLRVLVRLPAATAQPLMLSQAEMARLPLATTSRPLQTMQPPSV